MAKKRLTLTDLAGKVGPACLALSPDLQRAVLPPKPTEKPSAQFTQMRNPKPKKKTRPEMEMELILESQLQDGEIRSFDFEAITLVIGDPPTRYTPDFFVVGGHKSMPVKFIETKGSRIEEDAFIKFKVARKQYPCFLFELWQRSKDGEWRQLI